MCERREEGTRRKHTKKNTEFHVSYTSKVYDTRVAPKHAVRTTEQGAFVALIAASRHFAARHHVAALCAQHETKKRVEPGETKQAPMGTSTAEYLVINPRCGG